jgi:phosphatidylserine decarboxylase
MQIPNPILTREAWPLLTLAMAVATWMSYQEEWGWSVPLWLAVVWLIRLFRDPPRIVPQGAKAVLAPVDGRIVVIEPAQDPYLNRQSLKISVFMTIFNRHTNRSPVDGSVLQRWYKQSRNALHIRTQDNQDVTCVQIAGQMIQRVLCYVEKGKQLARGECYGFIRFGSRVDLYLPPETRVKVTLGDKVSASSTILAELP